MSDRAQKTRERILEAAYREFATHGLAGARVDRIAENAKANKRALYSYFGNKEDLFDTVFVSKLVDGATVVAANWDDLADYAGRLFDFFDADHDRARLNAWRQLERPEPSPAEMKIYEGIIADLRSGRGGDSLFDEASLFAIIYSIHHAWMLAPSALWKVTQRAETEDLERTRRRQAAVEAVRRISEAHT